MAERALSYRRVFQKIQRWRKRKKINACPRLFCLHSYKLRNEILY